jgi:type II secretory pathway component PulM
MAKKKDTLKDLNEFMKNQPTGAGEGTQDYLSKKPTQLAEVEALKSEIQKLNDIPEGALSEEEVANFIVKVSKAHQLSARQVLYRVCEKVLSQVEEKEGGDILLENLIVYLQHQDLLLEKIKS